MILRLIEDRIPYQHTRLTVMPVPEEIMKNKKEERREREAKIRKMKNPIIRRWS